jgi:2-dehydro-3-deoxy-D-gluconate 5-dehydrogenase
MSVTSQVQKSFDLSGKVALVTGAGTGIGQAIALGLAAAGAHVALVYRTDVSATLDALKDFPVKARSYQCDLGAATEQDVSDVFSSVISDFGGLDIVVNNAGTIHVSAATEYPMEEWDRVLRVNLTSAFLVARSAGVSFQSRGVAGRIINIASLLSFLGGHSVVAYTASKSALAGITKALAVEWASAGICVNAIAPGYVVTENTRRLLEDHELKAAIDSRIPAGRWGTPDDIVGPAIFLAADASRYVNGVILPVDGGLLAN